MNRSAVILSLALVGCGVPEVAPAEPPPAETPPAETPRTPPVNPPNPAEPPAARAPDAGAGQCAPTGGGPHWTEEGKPVTASISCATGRALAGTAFQIAALPAGAVYDPATATLTWTPKLDQAGVYLLT